MLSDIRSVSLAGLPHHIIGSNHMGTSFNCADVQTASTRENRDGANVFLIICHCPLLMKYGAKLHILFQIRVIIAKNIKFLWISGGNDMGVKFLAFSGTENT